MRLRVPILLERKGLTAYQLAKRSRGRISLSAAYRFARPGGAFRCLSPETLDALCEVLDCEPGSLFEREPAPRRRPS